MNKRFKNAIVMTGVLMVFDIGQGIMFTSFGKSDGTLKSFFQNLAIPPWRELQNLIPIALVSSVIVGTSVDYIRDKLGLGCVDDIGDTIEVILDELGE